MEEHTITEIKGHEVTWVHVNSNSPAAVEELRRRFEFHELDLQDVLPPMQRPKLTSRERYLFLILLFPYYNPVHKEIWITEVDFFISKHRLVTVNDKNDYAPLRDLVTRSVADADAAAALLASGVDAALYRILEALHQAAFPMLVHISQDIDELEEQLFELHGTGTVEEILRIKTNIVDFRRAMQGHKPVLEKLIIAGNGLFSVRHLQAYWSDLLDVTKEIWAYLETQRETISALHETHTSLLSHRINVVMKRLTLVSVVLLPLTLIASLFGMNVEHIPFAENPFGFWIVVGLLLTTLVVVVKYFKSRDWI